MYLLLRSPGAMGAMGAMGVMGLAVKCCVDQQGGQE